MSDQIKYLIIIIAMIFTAGVLSGQTLKEVASVDVTGKDFIKPVDVRTVNLANVKKTEFGLYNYAEMNTIFKGSINKELVDKYIVKIEGADGDEIWFPLNSTLKETSILQPILLLGKQNSHTGDTVKIYDYNSKKSQVNLDALEQEARKIYNIKYIMQAKDKDAIKSKLGANTFIFPEDQSTYRWVSKVKKLKLYLIQ